MPARCKNACVNNRTTCGLSGVPSIIGFGGRGAARWLEPSICSWAPFARQFQTQTSTCKFKMHALHTSNFKFCFTLGSALPPPSGAAASPRRPGRLPRPDPNPNPKPKPKPKPNPAPDPNPTPNLSWRARCARHLCGTTPAALLLQHRALRRRPLTLTLCLT